MTQSDCERLREIAPELALGIADGEDRAGALEHLADCGECRAHLERLSAIADEVLLVAPAVEPPAGFEARVAGTRAQSARRRSWARRLAIPAAAATVAAAAAAIVAWTAGGDERSLADAYRETLAVADGEYFDAAPLQAPGGVKVGYVYGYQGRASWVLAIVYDGVRDGSYRLAVASADGTRRPLRRMEVRDGHGSKGGVTPIPYDDVAEVRLLDGRGREVADADLHDDET